MLSGYLDEAVDEGELLERATAVAQQLAGLDREAHRQTKARVREELLASLDAAVSRDFQG